MNTLILYASKHGSVKKCAHTIVNKLNNPKAAVVNIKNSLLPNPADFDTIIIGASIYFGKINGKLKKYVSRIKESGFKGRIILFICSHSDDYDAVKKNFGPDFLNGVSLVSFLGFEIVLSKLNFFEKLIAKAIKVKQDQFCLKQERINKLIDFINS